MKSRHSSERHSGETARNFKVLAVLTLLAGGFYAHAESREISNRDMRIAAESGRAASGRVLREIDDPSSGIRWMLLGDETNHGGPGRLETPPGGSGSGVLGSQAKAVRGPQTKPVMIIRPGDKLLVEEHSATADAYLEGVALQAAVSGSVLNVRLSIGGRVVRAVAVAPGRAALEAAAGGRR